MRQETSSLQSLITEALDFGVFDLYVNRIVSEDLTADKVEILFTLSRDGESLEEFRHLLAGYDSNFYETGLLASFADDTFTVQVSER